MRKWEVEIEITPDMPDLEKLLDQWCRHVATTDTCALAVGGGHITHRLQAEDEGHAVQETLNAAREFFKDFEVRHPGTRAVD